MKTLKEFVRNKARPEGGMVEGYAIQETLGFCTEYMQEFQSTRRRIWDSKEDAGVVDELPKGNGKSQNMTLQFRRWAHSYVVNNSAVVDPWRRYVVN